MSENPEPKYRNLRMMYTDWQSTNDFIIRLEEPPHKARPESNDAFEVEETDGQTRIWPKGGDTILTADADNIDPDGSSDFCNACRSALGYLARWAENDLKPKEEQEAGLRLSVVHHWNLMNLHRSSLTGCPLCSMIWSRRFNNINWAFADLRLELYLNSSSLGSTDIKSPGDLRLISAIASTKTERDVNKFDSILRFQLWVTPDNDHFFIDDLTKQLGQVAVDDEGFQRPTTEASRPLALEWLAKCKNNVDGKHDACNKSDKSWKPTRLLDVATVAETGKVFLVETDSWKKEIAENNDYITLSHCWGEWGAQELPVLTQENLLERRDGGMDHDLLPQTFQDVIEVAHWFDVRYIWIDSLCIVQDSAEDWDREAPLMYEIYKNAMLNVSADASVDAREGCFKTRRAQAVLPFKISFRNFNNSTWWVTPDERTLFDWVNDAPLSKRAWVYQERHLSRRVLHFTKSEVFWECCAAVPSFLSETYPIGSPLPRDYIGQTKMSLESASAKTIKDDRALLSKWNAMCNDFSKRALSHQVDRLPSLSGLAQEFQILVPEDRYLAGLWSSDLPSGLLWAVTERSETRKAAIPPEPSTELITPSWSWLSAGKPISTNSAAIRHSIANIKKIDYTLQGADPFGRIKSAKLTIEGFVRKVTVITNEESAFKDDDDVHELYALLGSAHSRSLYVDDDLETSIGYSVGQAFGFTDSPDSGDSSGTRHYHCLLLEVSQYSSTSARDLKGLLLEPTGNPQEFRRVGTISHSVRGSSLDMRYQFKPEHRRKAPRRDSEEMRTSEAKAQSTTTTTTKTTTTTAMSSENKDHSKKVDIEQPGDDVQEESTDETGSDQEQDEGNRDTHRYTPYQQLSQILTPYWDTEYSRDEGGRKAPLEVHIRGTGPMSLYDFDEAGADIIRQYGIEKLTTEIITLV